MKLANNEKVIKDWQFSQYTIQSGYARVKQKNHLIVTNRRVILNESIKEEVNISEVGIDKINGFSIEMKRRSSFFIILLLVIFAGFFGFTLYLSINGMLGLEMLAISGILLIAMILYAVLRNKVSSFSIEIFYQSCDNLANNFGSLSLFGRSIRKGKVNKEVVEEISATLGNLLLIKD